MSGEQWSWIASHFQICLAYRQVKKRWEEDSLELKLNTKNGHHCTTSRAQVLVSRKLVMKEAPNSKGGRCRDASMPNKCCPSKGGRWEWRNTKALLGRKIVVYKMHPNKLVWKRSYRKSNVLNGCCHNRVLHNTSGQVPLTLILPPVTFINKKQLFRFIE